MVAFAFYLRVINKLTRKTKQMKTSHKILIASGLISGVASVAAISHAAFDERHGGKNEHGEYMSHGKRGKHFMKSLDTDEDGMISQAEIQANLQMQFDALDLDGNGQIGIEEFSSKRLERFAMIDGNGDLFITKDELREMRHERKAEGHNEAEHDG